MILVVQKTEETEREIIDFSQSRQIVFLKCMQGMDTRVVGRS